MALELGFNIYIGEITQDTIELTWTYATQVNGQIVATNIPSTAYITVKDYHRFFPDVTINNLSGKSGSLIISENGDIQYNLTSNTFYVFDIYAMISESNGRKFSHTAETLVVPTITINNLSESTIDGYSSTIAINENISVSVTNCKNYTFNLSISGEGDTQKQYTYYYSEQDSGFPNNINIPLPVDDIYRMTPNSRYVHCSLSGYTLTSTNRHQGQYVSPKQFRIDIEDTDDNVPTFDNFEFVNTDVDVIRILGDDSNSYTIQGHPSLKVFISKDNEPVTKKYSTLDHYYVFITNIDDNSFYGYEASNYQSDASGTIIDFMDDFETISKPGRYRVDVGAFDSRGKSCAAYPKFYEVLRYAQPSVSNINIERVNGYDKEISLQLQCNYYNLLNKNSIQNVKWQFKTVDGSYSEKEQLSFTELSDSSPISKIIIVRDSTHNGYLHDNFDPQNTYIVRFEITDSLSTSSFETTVAAGVPIFFRSENGYVAVGRIPDWSSDAKFQTDTDILFKYNGQDSLLSDAINNRIIIDDNEPDGSMQQDGSFWFKSITVDTTVT